MEFSLDRFYRINRRVLSWIILGVLLYLMRDFFGLIFLTFVLAFTAAPLARFGQRYLRMTRRISIIVTYGLFLIGIVSFATFITPMVVNEAEVLITNFGGIEQKVLEMKRTLVAKYPFLDPLIMGYLQSGLPEQAAPEESGGDTQKRILERLDAIHQDLAAMRGERLAVAFPDFSTSFALPAAALAPPAIPEQPGAGAAEAGGGAGAATGRAAPRRAFGARLAAASAVPAGAQDEPLIRWYMRRQMESFSRYLPHLVKTLWTVSVTLMLALLFSFLISLDISQIVQEVEQLRNSRLHDFYEQTARPVVRFGYVVGRGLQAQAAIAVVTTLLTLIGMAILRIPSLAMLSFVVFVLSFIPVLGVFISTVPIALLALNVGGLGKAAAVVVMVVLIHIITTYALNPLIYGRHLKLNPVLVLIILFVGYHAFGLWGMLLGVPVAHYFIHDVFGVPVWGETWLGPSDRPSGQKPPTDAAAA